MGATSYERLSETRRRGGAWAVLRRGLLRLCAAPARRQGRWAQARRGRSRCRRVSARCGYDAEGYARNFDEGVWKAEEGVPVPWMTAGVVGRCPVLL